ncbi:LRR receptor-like serine threonine-protein kinase [Seminavis robusta]|uniref:LRR receptor-like serine threonine-protein kinase n=1 Tax=Seminavis robusta TaxID=568900 RepID=A0A9N8DAB0_9STRA|nr:LRR receptor-like serine threonine-protein kinase [Seminavis robusta]|eukprot:Sro14_g010410.1 LRR receptor-like serine threonine-protein kinase (953) ;mRNA; r:20980-23921
MAEASSSGVSETDDGAQETEAEESTAEEELASRAPEESSAPTLRAATEEAQQHQPSTEKVVEESACQPPAAAAAVPPAAEEIVSLSGIKMEAEKVGQEAASLPVGQHSRPAEARASLSVAAPTVTPGAVHVMTSAAAMDLVDDVAPMGANRENGHTNTSIGADQSTSTGTSDREMTTTAGEQSTAEELASREPKGSSAPTLPAATKEAQQHQPSTEKVVEESACQPPVASAASAPAAVAATAIPEVMSLSGIKMETEKVRQSVASLPAGQNARAAEQRASAAAAPPAIPEVMSLSGIKRETEKVRQSAALLPEGQHSRAAEQRASVASAAAPAVTPGAVHVMTSAAAMDLVEDVAPMGANMENGHTNTRSIRADQSASVASTRHQQAATPHEPGAYPRVPSWRRFRASFTGEESAVLEGRSLIFGLEPGDSDYNMSALEGGNNAGLVQAQPVSPSSAFMVQAQPVDPAQARPVTTARRKETSSRAALVLLIVVGGCVVLVAVGVTVYLLQLQQQNANDEASSATMSQVASNTTTVSNEIETWNLDFVVPNSTLHEIFQNNHNGTTPQYRAYQWMKQDPYLANYSPARQRQRFVMVTLYYATHGQDWLHQGGGTISIETDGSLRPPPPPSGTRPMDTGGIGSGPPPGEPKNDGSSSVYINITSEPWLSYEHSECTWFSTASFRTHEACDENQTLTFLGVMQNNLQGSLPQELGLLTDLRAFELARNRIGGPLISQLGALTKLDRLHLFDNEMTGKVPSEIGRLRAMFKFGLLQNQFTGSLPAELFRLSNLGEIKISWNFFTGRLPSDLGVHSKRLRDLQIPHNQFSGPIPSCIGLLTGLMSIILHENRFESSLPTELGNAKQLQRLLAPDNLLTGTLPSELAQLEDLQQINLEGNVAIVGTLPQELRLLNDTLRVLKIADTQISGTIPEELCHVSILSFDCSSSLCGCDCPCG